MKPYLLCAGFLKSQSTKTDFLSVENMYAPTRAYLGTEGVSGAIGLLVDCEDRIDAMKADLVKYGHGAGKVTHVPFGEHIEIKFEKSDAILDLYPALFDWSETRASALVTCVRYDEYLT